MYGIGRIAIALAVFFSAWAAYFSLGIVPLTPVTLSILIAVTSAGLPCFLKGNISARRVDIYFLLYVIVLFFSALFSDNIVVGMQYWRVWLMSFLGYVAVRTLFKTARDMQVLRWAGVFGAIMTFMNITQSTNEWGGVGRAGIEGLNTNFSAYALTGYLYIYLICISLDHKAPIIKRILDLAIILMFLSVVYILETRGALISCFLMLLYWRLSPKISKGSMKIIVVSAATIGFLLSFGYLDVLISLLDFYSNRASENLSGRGDIWPEARRFFSENWLIGVGPGQFATLTERGVGSHNFVLTVGLDSGVIGLIVISVFFADFSRILSRARLGPRRINLAGLFLMYWLPIALSGHWELAALSWIVVAFSVQVAQIISRI